MAMVSNMTNNKHNSNADLMTAWCTPAGQLPLDVAARRQADLAKLTAAQRFAIEHCDADPADFFPSESSE